MKKNLFNLILILALLSGCIDSGIIIVKNNFSNKMITDIYWDVYFVGDSLLPGQSSEEIRVSELKDRFPMAYPINFNVKINHEDSSGTLAITVDSFKLDYDETLFIVIDESTNLNYPWLEY